MITTTTLLFVPAEPNKIQKTLCTNILLNFSLCNIGCVQRSSGGLVNIGIPTQNHFSKVTGIARNDANTSDERNRMSRRDVGAREYGRVHFKGDILIGCWALPLRLFTSDNGRFCLLATYVRWSRQPSFNTITPVEDRFQI